MGRAASAAGHAALHDLSQPAALGDAWTSPSLWRIDEQLDTTVVLIATAKAAAAAAAASATVERQPGCSMWHRDRSAGDAMGWGATHGLTAWLRASQAAAHATLRASRPGRTTCRRPGQLRRTRRPTHRAATDGNATAWSCSAMSSQEAAMMQQWRASMSRWRIRLLTRKRRWSHQMHQQLRSAAGPAAAGPAGQPHPGRAAPGAAPGRRCSSAVLQHQPCCGCCTARPAAQPRVWQLGQHAGSNAQRDVGHLAGGATWAAAAAQRDVWRYLAAVAWKARRAITRRASLWLRPRPPP